MSQLTMINGVDAHGLADAVNMIRDDPSLAQFQFRVRNKWLGGGQNRSAIQDFHAWGKEDDTRTHPFVLDCDEPHVLLGNDQAPNPAEYVLHALAGCLTTSLAHHAAAHNIEIESIQSEVDGEIDIREFLGLSNKVPRSFQKIRVTMHVRSDAPISKLEELAQFSPVYNALTRPVAVELRITKDD